MKYYVTTPIYYVNDVPHIGHAYTTIAADVMARYKRLKGFDVFFLTGTDEHGQKIEKSAREKGITPKELADSVVVRFKDLWRKFNISYDHFIRTTDSYHEEVVKEIFQKLYDKGDIYLGEYEGWYCTPCESFWSDGQLIEGKYCPDCRRPVDRVKEESYFFRLSKYQDALLKLYEERPDFVMPKTRMNEIVSFVKQGLKDVSISRTTFKWGIPVPFDDKHVIYVWFDALFNYISGIGYGRDNDKFKKFWPADLHLIGKDILRFHAIYWPAFLMAAGFEVPKRVFAHGWWTVEGRKMSKSLKNVVEPNRLADTYGVDAVRYFLMKEVPFGLDGDFSHRALAHRINGDLANDLGNLVYRVLSMTIKYFNSTVPEPSDDRDKILEDLAKEVIEDIDELMDNQAFNKVLDRIWDLIRKANKYIDETAPWALYKSKEMVKLSNVMYNLIETIRLIGVLIFPFMPQKSMELLKQLGYKNEPQPEDMAWGVIKPGTRLEKGKPLFPKLDEEEIAKAIEEEVKEAEEDEEEDKIDIQDFAKVKVVVAMVESAERVKNSKKLIKLELNTGTSKKTVVAGIGEYYTPEELLGKRILYLSNLKPKKLMGILSEGMLLAADDGKRPFVIFVPEEVPLGAVLK